MRERLHVLLTGTDPNSGKGGIAFALQGYFAALDIAGLEYSYLVSHHPETRFGKWLPFLISIPKLIFVLIGSVFSGRQIIVYSHTGAGVSMLREGILQCLSRICGAKTVLQIHAPELDQYLNRGYTLRLLRFILVGSDVICVLTPWWQQRMRPFFKSKEIQVVPNPLPKNWELVAHGLTEFHKAPFPLRILTMARIEEGKGVDLIIRAMERLGVGYSLVVAGNGRQLSQLQEYVKQRDISEKVTFVGWVSGDKKQELLNSADIFCLPTQYDAMPMSILEALANGLPVVALNWGPIADLVPNNEVGVLSDEFTADGVAEAISRLQDSTLREEMSNAAKQWVIRNYSPEFVGQKLTSIFARLVGND